MQKRSIDSFRDQWLEDFFLYGTPHKKIPAGIESSMARKLDIINAAISHRDLRSPPGNRYEVLNPPLGEYSSIRVNEQYRLIFKWYEGKAYDLYLDAHTYKKHK
ncbi:type II toxin-antitoxin system RelE/ParE family toxin [Prodigiosinella aquatilis]|uniref:type II toxin-antitoxin system RelE/ParE family toxin n=1 Tax=Brenneria uluponensis TaxID=3057057 RepID=UPI0025B5A342|nr:MULTISPECIES: type II toxin-antitoxin system RelE/ParE family toxin [Pectobacteriaceae]WJV52949.1 type II toxin-antitoxin system RelE/ParE family toxin [Prodigiosinella sp. LS101]WJV57304.1 type II toxin-antitoxin system RelE/ParE family toxin [Pectobacteriaceae bacterium C111]